MDIKKIGSCCAKARKRNGLKQYQIAQVTNYSPSNISMFECGRVNNMALLLWYVEHLFNDTEKAEIGITGGVIAS